MAEYIDKDIAIQICMNSWGTDDASQDIKDESPADVIERAEYEKVLEENKQLKHIISDKVDKDLKCAFEVKELRSKIDKAIGEMDSIDLNEYADNTYQLVNKCIEILKRNIEG